MEVGPLTCQLYTLTKQSHDIEPSVACVLVVPCSHNHAFLATSHTKRWAKPTWVVQIDVWPCMTTMAFGIV